MPISFWPSFSVRESPVHFRSPARGPGKARVVEQHREKAPRLFVEELAAIVKKLRNGADDDVSSMRHEGVA